MDAEVLAECVECRLATLGDDEQLHIFPPCGRDHVLSGDCWCRPETWRTPMRARLLIVHNGAYLAQVTKGTH